MTTAKDFCSQVDQAIGHLYAAIDYAMPIDEDTAFRIEEMIDELIEIEGEYLEEGDYE